MSTATNVIVPPARSRYLAEIADTVRAYLKRSVEQSRVAREVQQIGAVSAMLASSLTPAKAGAPSSSATPLGPRVRGDDESQEATVLPDSPSPVVPANAGTQRRALLDDLSTLAADRESQLDAASRKLLAMWPAMQKAYAGDEYVVKIRDKEIRTALTTRSLSGTVVRKVALPRYEDHGETLKWLMRENVPGSFPFTAGTFAFKREGEDPTRMFAGEGDPFRTNRRFKHVSEGMAAKRLSTAFDSVTLYGHEPDLRPDIYGKVGNSGVSIATLDDMKVLYSGFDLTSPTTSVSMTINGPAPSILAMFMNTAIDQNLDKFRADNGREATDDETQKIRAWVLANVRGTVQADILKEDQARTPASSRPSSA